MLLRRLLIGVTLAMLVLSLTPGANALVMPCFLGAEDPFACLGA